MPATVPNLVDPEAEPSSLASRPGVPGRVVPYAVPVPAPAPTLAALFEAEEDSLLRFALGLVGRRPVAEELVQETFLRLHQVWSQVQNPRAWLYRSLRNLALNHLRDQRPEIELNPAEHAGDERQPDEALGRLEAVGTVRLLLAELPEDDRQLVQLKYVDGLKYEQIARRTGLSVGNVGYKLHHLLKSLTDGLRRAGSLGHRGWRPSAGESFSKRSERRRERTMPGPPRGRQARRRTASSGLTAAGGNRPGWPRARLRRRWAR